MASSKLSFCANVVRTNDRDRYLPVFFAPAEHRDALFALYAFNIEVAKIRETVSEPMIREIRLQWWREAIDDAFNGKIQSHEVMQALGPVITKRGLSRKHFDNFFDAREYDLYDQPLSTIAALEEYAVGTSATLNWLALELLDASGKSENEAVRHVGVAWALVGLLRALPFHASAKRVYLPSDLMARNSFDRERLIEFPPPHKLSVAVAEIADIARERLSASRVFTTHVAAAALPVLLSAVIASAHLRHLAYVHYDPYALNSRQPALLPLLLAGNAFFKRY